MIARMNQRQFKKLCKKSHALVTRIHSRWSGHEYVAPRDHDVDDWHSHGVLKGTVGFYFVDGFDSCDGECFSAFDALKEISYWHFSVVSEKDGSHQLPDGIRMHRWQDVLALGERVALVCAKGGAA